MTSDTKTTNTKTTIGIGHCVRGGNRGSGEVSVTRPFSLGETQQDSDATRGRGAGIQEAMTLQMVAQQLTTNQRTRGAWQKAAVQQKAVVDWQQEAAWQ
jgi:hypothetical protein